MDDEQAKAYRAQYPRRVAAQKALDAALTPVSDAPAEATRQAWEPMRQFVQEGPDVGQRQEPASEKGQRIN